MLRILKNTTIILFTISLLSTKCFAVTTQVHLTGLSTTAINTASTIFVYPNAGGGGSTTETNRVFPSPTEGNITYLKACLTVDPANGAGVQSVSFTARVASADSSTTCTVTEGDSDLCCESTTASAYTAGQLLSLEVTPANTPTAANFTTVIHTQDSTDKKTFYGSNGNGNVSNSATNYQAFVPGSNPQTDENMAQVPIPYDFTATALYCQSMFGSPGTGNSYTMAVVHNGSTVGTLTCAISGTGTTCNDTTNTFTGSAGDTLSVEIIPASTPTARPIACGVALTNTGGGFMLAGGQSANYADALNTYYHPLSGPFSYSTTEGDRTQKISAVTLKAAYGDLFVAPDNGALTQSYTYTVRDDAGATGCSFVISEAAVSGSDTACTDVIAVDSDIGYELVPSLIPAATGGWVSVWGILTTEDTAVSRRRWDIS